jgi:hypothetical protein
LDDQNLEGFDGDLDFSFFHAACDFLPSSRYSAILPTGLFVVDGFSPDTDRIIGFPGDKCLELSTYIF